MQRKEEEEGGDWKEMGEETREEEGVGRGEEASSPAPSSVALVLTLLLHRGE